MEEMTLSKVIRHIEEIQEFTCVSLEFSHNKWWVQFIKDGIKSVPAVDKRLETAYVQGLTNMEAVQQSVNPTETSSREK
jgi:hypothetical protein